MNNKNNGMTLEYRIMELEAQLKARELDEENRSYYREWPERIAKAQGYQTHFMLCNHKMQAGTVVYVMKCPPGAKFVYDKERMIFDLEYVALDTTLPLAQISENVLRDCPVMGKGIVLEGHPNTAIVSWLDPFAPLVR